ncbi:MAG: hypothetical protein ACXV5N_08140, partial [Halobacteriota archaeon]
MKKYLALFLIALMAVSIVSAAGVVTAGVASAARPEPTTPSTPLLVSPNDAATFSVGQGIPFEWSKVSGATSYTIVFQQFTDGQWVYSQTKRTGDAGWSASSTEAGTFRWHVMATHGKL